MSEKEREVGPLYGVPLIVSLPLGGGFSQAMPSRGDLLLADRTGHARLAAGYEVLLASHQRLLKVLESFPGFSGYETAGDTWLSERDAAIAQTKGEST